MSARTEPGRGHGTPTLHDVARIAGVSLATASRVLNGSSRTVADSYREKVENVAAELGYTANISAQATAKGTSSTIALLVADIADPYFGIIAAGVMRGADEAGLVVTISVTERDDERELRLVRALRGQRPRGVIFAASRTTEVPSSGLQRELDAVISAGGQVVALGPGITSARSILIDNRGGARALGEELKQNGYDAAVVLGAPEGTYTSDERIAGFIEGFGEAGQVAVLRDGLTRVAGERAMARALGDGVPRGTVVFAVTDVVALGALTALRNAGRAVGSDIALAGFDDIPASRDVTPALTSVRIPLEDIGYAAFRAAVDDEWSAPEPMALEVRLRASTPRRSGG